MNTSFYAGLLLLASVKVTAAPTLTNKMKDLFGSRNARFDPALPSPEPNEWSFAYRTNQEGDAGPSTLHYADHCGNNINIQGHDESPEQFLARLGTYQEPPQDSGYLNEPNEPVYYKAYYPKTNKIRHLSQLKKNTDQTVKDFELPVHPKKDTRRAFLLRQDQIDEDRDWNEFGHEINNDLQKQNAFRHLKSKKAFFYPPHSAAYFEESMDPYKVRDALFDGKLPTLYKSKETNALHFARPGSQQDYQNEFDGSPDRDYHGEISDDNTEHLL